MIKEIKRIEHKGLTFRLIYNPEYYRIIEGKKYPYKWIIQARRGKRGKFDSLFFLQSKKDALEHFKVKEMQVNYMVTKLL